MYNYIICTYNHSDSTVYLGMKMFTYNEYTIAYLSDIGFSLWNYSFPVAYCAYILIYVYAW